MVTLNTDRDSSTIGRAATIEIGDVKTLHSGAAAYVRNSGTSNAAVLDFGIPSGSNGDDGMSGYGISADPASVTFNTDSKGNISSSQDKLIRMKAYLGGQEIDDVTIVGLSTTNFANTVSAESDGKSFYLRGSDLQTVHTTDLDGNSIKVPVTQAQVAVDCKIGGSDLVYSTIVRVFVNTQTFYTTLVSNQKMFKQTFTELSNSLDEQGVKLEKYYSVFQQTARGLSATISSNKQDADGSIENITNKLEATSSSLSSTIEANKKDADGNIEKLKSEFKQTTDEITSTVEQNKTDADGKLESLSSKISQNAKNIEIANSRFNEDGSLKNKSGLMTTADKATLASREYVDGKVVNEATITTMINNGISTATIKADQIQFSGHQVKFDAGEIVINSKNFNLDGYGNVTMSGEIHATSGWFGNPGNNIKIATDETGAVGLSPTNTTGWKDYNNICFTKTGQLYFNSTSEDKKTLTTITSGSLSVGRADRFGMDAPELYVDSSGEKLQIVAKCLPKSASEARSGCLYDDNGTIKIKA